MKSLRMALVMGAFAVGICGFNEPDPETGAVVETQQAQQASASGERGTQAASSASAMSCTTTYSECRVGPCERANDDFTIVTDTCCDAAGNCTTTKMKVCGCY